MTVRGSAAPPTSSMPGSVPAMRALFHSGSCTVPMTPLGAGTEQGRLPSRLSPWSARYVLSVARSLNADGSPPQQHIAATRRTATIDVYSLTSHSRTSWFSRLPGFERPRQHRPRAGRPGRPRQVGGIDQVESLARRSLHSHVERAGLAISVRTSPCPPTRQLDLRTRRPERSSATARHRSGHTSRVAGTSPAGGAPDRRVRATRRCRCPSEPRCPLRTRPSPSASPAHQRSGGLATVARRQSVSRHDLP